MLFDHFLPRRKAKKPDRQEKLQVDIDALQRKLSLSQVECRTQNELARTDCERALSKARRAVSVNDMRLKAIAVNELRMAMAVFKYTDALTTNLMMMESNLRMQGVTANFAGMVDRMSMIRVPAGMVDFSELTRKALRGLQPVDLEGVEQFTKSLIEASLSATGTVSATESELDDLINGRTTIDQMLAGNTPAVHTAAQHAAHEHTAPAQTSDEDLIRMLDEITDTLKMGG